jgi:hypothetical protein
MKFVIDLVYFYRNFLFLKYFFEFSKCSVLAVREAGEETQTAELA